MMSMNSTPSLQEQPTDVRAPLSPDVSKLARSGTRAHQILLLLTAIFFALHFVHLKADFPNHSPWMDWSKYTDEGWYGDAAIRHYQLGHWNVPGDFNPAAALPVWPVLEGILFSVTGVSLVAARALTVTVFGMILVCSYRLIRRWTDQGRDSISATTHRSPIAAPLAVLLLAVSPLCYAFSRLAILEPLLILLTLISLLAASAAGAASAAVWAADRAAAQRRLRLRFGLSTVGLGLLLPLMVLTKTTGVFLFPALFWLLWASTGYQVSPFLRAAALACGVGIAAWSGYFMLLVRPHYLMDYRYLFSANAYTGVTTDTFWSVLQEAVLAGRWIGIVLFPLAGVALIGSFAEVATRRSRSNPLLVALLLWIFGYGAFLVYHANLQPRYYLVLAVPFIILIAIEFETLIAATVKLGWSKNSGKGRRYAAAMIGGLTASVMGVALCSGAWQTLGFVRHPEYGWWSAAQQVRDVVEREAALSTKGGTAHSRLVLSISGSDLSLMTGLPSICDDFGTMALADRVVADRPGWFATWNDVEDDKMEALAPLYRLERVSAIRVFDDPDRNVLILYRLDPLSSPGSRGRSGRRRFLSVPRRLRTRMGEQPSATQLRH
jgi:hypothetical protein